MSWSAGILILFRGLQAIGGALLASNSPAIVTGNFPVEERGRAFGLVSMMTYLGLTVGPSLGGWLTHAFGWRTVFYINVPVGLLALTLGLIFIPKDSPTESEKRFDLPGAAVFLAALTLLLLGLNKGADWGWSSPSVLGLLAGAAAFMAVFILIERRSSHPMLDLNLFRVPLFSTSTLGAILNYICLFSITFLMPFYLIQGRGLNPAQAGLLLTVQPVLMAITAPVSGTYQTGWVRASRGCWGWAFWRVGCCCSRAWDPGRSCGWSHSGWPSPAPGRACSSLRIPAP